MSNRNDPSGAALNTAYAYNTRQHSPYPAPVRSGWHSRIDDLLARDYSFLPCGYSDTGCLFRGMSRGLSACIDAGCWRLSEDDSPLGALERELGVFLLSHDLSDALSVSRLWQAQPDAAVLVFPAAEFRQRWEERAAAVLGFAEPGVVFKYPFLVEPLPMQSVQAIFVAGSYDGSRKPGFFELPAAAISDRSETERYVREALQQRGVTAALAIETNRYPRRS
jgi:hypothetical protein